MSSEQTSSRPTSLAVELIRRFSSPSSSRVYVEAEDSVANHQQPSSTQTPKTVVGANADERPVGIQAKSSVAPADSNAHGTVSSTAEDKAKLKQNHSYFQREVFRDVDIYFGSTTGTSASFASQLAQAVHLRGVGVRVRDLIDFHPEEFLGQENFQVSKLVVFIVSTYGDGGPTDSAKRFHAWLATEHILRARADSYGGSSGADHSHDEQSGRGSARFNKSNPESVHGSGAGNATSIAGAGTSSESPTASSPSQSPSKGSSIRKMLEFGKSCLQGRHTKTRFKGMNYAVFGMGNSVYAAFNGMAKFVDTKLHELGATRVIRTGLGDASEDPDAVFLKWQLKLLKRLPAPPKAEQSAVFSCSSSSSSSMSRTSTQASLLVTGPAEQPKRASGDFAPVDESNELVLHPVEQNQALSRLTVSNTPDALRTNSTAVASETGGGRRPVLSRKSVTQSSAYRPAAIIERIELFCEDDSPLELPDFEAVAAACSTQPNSTASSATSASSASTLTQRPSINSSPDTGSMADIKTRVIYIRLALQEPICHFEAADNFAILPHNCQSLVEMVASRLKFDLDAVCELPLAEVTTNTFNTNSGQSNNSRRNLFRSQNYHSSSTKKICSVRSALTDFLEIHSISREFIRQIADFAKAPKEREHLERLASTDGSQEFNRLFNAQHANLLVLLNLAPSLTIKFEEFINITPIMKPRCYTIASSPLQDSKKIDLVISIRQEAMGLMLQYLVELLGRLRMLPQQQTREQQEQQLVDHQQHEEQRMQMLHDQSNLCQDAMTLVTSFGEGSADGSAPHPIMASAGTNATTNPGTLAQSNAHLPQATYWCGRMITTQGPVVRGFVFPSRFRVPTNPQAPLVMIANGAGIAPMRAVLLHRQLMNATSKTGHQGDSESQTQESLLQPLNTPPGVVILFYGCRNRRSILFQNELSDLDKTGLISLRLAFSRDSEASSSQYVQDLLARDLSEVVALLLSSNESRILVCGSVDMAKATRKLFEAHGKARATENNAVMTWFDAMRQSCRYVEEAWS